MPPDRRTLRDIRYAYHNMQRTQRIWGQWVQWFRFNQTSTTSDPVYSTGPGRLWYPPLTIPVQLGIYERALKNFDDDGLYLVDETKLIMSYDAFFHSGIIDPDPTGEDHLNDRVAFDGRLFELTSFIPKGRVADMFLTISASAREVAQEDLAEDPAAAMFAPYVAAS